MKSFLTRIAALLAFCQAAHTLEAQNPAYFFTKFGDDAQEKANSVAQLPGGGYVVAGVINGFSTQQTDIFVGITDTLGFPLVQKSLGGFLTDVATGVAVLPDSSIIVVGYTNSFGAGGYDGYFARLNPKGGLLWQTTFGGVDWDFVNSVRACGNGQVIACGSSYSFNRGKRDAFILKLDSSGSILWQKIYGGPEDDELKEIVPTADGGFIAAGTTCSYGDTLGDIWITRFNASGDSLWFMTRGGTKADVGTSVAQGPKGNYYVAGGSKSFSGGREDAYVFELSQAKALVWEKNLGLPDKDERIVRAVSSRGQKGGVAFCYTTLEHTGFRRDPKMLLLDSTGTYAGGGYLGSDQDEEMFAVANTNDKGYIFAGYTMGFSGFKAKDPDIYLVKFDSLMNPGSFHMGLNDAVQASTGHSRFLYPNPFKGSLRLRPGGEKVLGLEISDSHGRLIYAAPLGEEVKEIVLPGLREGMYIARVATGRGVFYEKLFCSE